MLIDFVGGKMEEKKCPICGKQSKKGQKLCSQHFSQYWRQRETEGRSLSEFISFSTMNVNSEVEKYKKITEENAEEQKLFWQAIKEQQHALRVERENLLRSKQLVDRAEYEKATIIVMRGILERFEKISDIWPDALAQRTAGDVRKKVVELVENLRSDIESFLESL